MGAPPVGGPEPSATVSVVVGGHDPEGLLPLTLATLSEQSYPASLLEVVVGVDGVDEGVLEEAPGDLDVRVVRQGEVEAAAGGEILLFLQAGALAARALVAAHARWHHAIGDAVSIGFSAPLGRAGLDAWTVKEVPLRGDLGGLVERGAEEGGPSSLEAVLDATEGLTRRTPELFTAAARSNVAMRADLHRAAGCLRGLEDTALEDAGLAALDLAYRLDLRGCLFVPERSARALDPYPDSASAARGRRAEDLIPMSGFRPQTAGRVFARPAMGVDVPVGRRRAGEALEAVDAVLQGHFSDLRLRLLVPGDHPERGPIRTLCADDPRVAVLAPADDDPCEAPYRVTISPAARVGPGTLGMVRALMESEGLGLLRVSAPWRLRPRSVGGRRLRLPTAAPVLTAVACGPLARARRVAEADGRPVERVLADLFGARTVPAAEMGMARRGGVEPRDRTALPPREALARERAEHLRHRARAARAQARVDRQAQRAARERSIALRERAEVERLEARLSRTVLRHSVSARVNCLGRRLADAPARAALAITAVRSPSSAAREAVRLGHPRLHRARQAAFRRLRRLGLAGSD